MTSFDTQLEDPPPLWYHQTNLAVARGLYSLMKWPVLQLHQLHLLGFLHFSVIRCEKSCLQIQGLRYSTMKFDRNQYYYKHQIVEWTDVYVNYATLKRVCKESTASINLQGKRQIRTFVNCLFPRALHAIHDSDLLEYLEIATRCVDALDTIDQFYCNNYITLLMKLSFKSRLRDPYNDIHAEFTGHFDSYGLDYVELQH